MTSNSPAEHARETELAHEQAYLTMLYERLDVLRAATKERLAQVRLGPTAENDQGWSEREMFAREYQDRSAELDAAERSLCFGRLDFDDADRFYIGRIGLRGDDHDQMLVDWRARAAEPFYRATPRERYGVTRRRHLHTAGRRVVSVDDDVLDLDAVDENRLTGEAALLASLRRGRTGRMGDIVATIQADQDRIIREDPGGILVVEGGPGTGKTVVALHRAAYLLYTHRKRLARRGILVLGPSATFLRYIDQVLPSLGESDVVLATTSSLFPGVEAVGEDSPAAARVKGDAKMADALSKAVTSLRQQPAADIEIRVDGMLYRLTPRICGLARAEAEERLDDETDAPLPHNIARRVFITEVVRLLDRQRARDLGVEPGDAGDLRELAAEPAIRGVLDVLWPEAAPQQLLTRLYAEPGRLDLTDGERAAIARRTPGPWTPADVPLLDELAELLGPLAAIEREARRRQAEDDAERAEQLEYSSQLVSKLVEDGAIALPPLEHDTFVGWIAGRNTEVAPAGSLAERALRDRTWAYGHVIVDEAQELSAMDWRMVLRRCPARSMTVVGDLAQTAAPGGADSWAQVLDPVAARRWRTARLTVNYRTPAPVMALAATLLPPGAQPPQSVRDSAESPWHADGGTADLADLVRRESELIGSGRVAVIAPPARLAGTAVALGLAPGPDLDAPVAVLTAQQAKGLEFDSVIIVDPEGIEQASPRGRADLYVALTRTTRRLGLISHASAIRQNPESLLSRTDRGDSHPATCCSLVVGDAGEAFGHLPEPPLRRGVMGAAAGGDQHRVPGELPQAAGPVVVAAPGGRVGRRAQHRERAAVGPLVRRQRGQHPHPERKVTLELRRRGSRMRGQRGRGAACRREPALQLVGEHQVRQLGLPVGPHGPVPALEGEVVEVNVAEPVAVAADRDDPGAGRGEQHVEDQARQREVAEVVDAELQLEPVLRAPVRRHHHSGVVDQQVDPGPAGPQPRRGVPHRGERAEVKAQRTEVRGGDRRPYPADGVVRLAGVPAGQHHGGAAGGQRPGRLEAQAAVGAGDHRGLPGQVRNVGAGPVAVAGTACAHRVVLLHDAAALREGLDVIGALGDLLARAQRAGVVPGDVDTVDVKALITGCLARMSGTADPAARDRIIRIACRGLRAG